MLAVTPAHRPPRGFGDWAAWKIVRVARWGMDFCTGMSRKQASDPKKPTTAIVADAAAFAAPKPTPEFRADHPFVYYIQDRETGAIVFIGRMTTPE